MMPNCWIVLVLCVSASLACLPGHGNDDVCGKSKRKGVRANDDAEPTAADLSPFVAELHSNGTLICTAVLLTDHYVLAERRCVEDAKNTYFELLVGEDEEDKEKKGEVYKVTHVSTAEMTAVASDLVLLYVPGEIKFDDRAAPVCQPDERASEKSDHCYVVGFGLETTKVAKVEETEKEDEDEEEEEPEENTEKNKANADIDNNRIPTGEDEQTSQAPNALKLMKSTVVSNDQCDITFDKEFVAKKMICVEGEEGAACQSQLGLPLICLKDDRWRLYGVLQKGADCDLTDNTDNEMIFHDTHFFAQWIEARWRTIPLGLPVFWQATRAEPIA